MPFKDIDIFVRAAEAILQGQDPYSIPGLEVFYPLPFYFLFVPFVALTPTWLHIGWTLLQGVTLLAILRKRTALVALSMPVLLCLLLGQVDIIMMALFALLRSGIAGGVALAFLVLKPHLVLLLAPWMLWHWWRHERRQILLFALVLGGILVSSLIVQPDWLMRLFSRSGERTRAAVSSSLWGLLSFLPTPLWFGAGALLTFGLVFWAWRRSNLDIVATVGLLVSPFIFSYNLLPLTVMVRQPLALLGWTALSWFVFAVAAIQENDGASALMTVAVLFGQSMQSEKQEPPSKVHAT